MRWFQHIVPDLTGRWIPPASTHKGMAHFNPEQAARCYGIFM
jgi:hypothetical protein